jgi:hypothetical protein
LFWQLNVLLNAEMSAADLECLSDFSELRRSLAGDVDMTPKDEDAMIDFQAHTEEEMSTHELLIAEVL